VENQELKNLAEETANRLRVIQIDFSQEEPGVQKEYMSEEIKRSLKTIHPEHKNRFLSILKEHFPVSFGSEEKAVHQSFSPREERAAVPETVINQFVQVYANLSSDNKQKLHQFLNTKGIPCGQSGIFSEDQLKVIKSLLQLKEETRISSENLIAVVPLMLEAFIKLESVVQSTWMQLNPSNNISGLCKLRNTIKKCLIEGEEIESHLMAQEIKKFHLLIIALIMGIGGIGKIAQQFSQSFLSRYSPREISKAVRLEGSGFWTSHNAKCWRKYQQLSSGISRDSIEREIATIFKDYINQIVQLGQHK